MTQFCSSTTHLTVWFQKTKAPLKGRDDVDDFWNQTVKCVVEEQNWVMGSGYKGGADPKMPRCLPEDVFPASAVKKILAWADKNCFLEQYVEIFAAMDAAAEVEIVE